MSSCTIHKKRSRLNIKTVKSRDYSPSEQVRNTFPHPNLSSTQSIVIMTKSVFSNKLNSVAPSHHSEHRLRDPLSMKNNKSHRSMKLGSGYALRARCIYPLHQ